jgi:hypothetical protein
LEVFFRRTPDQMWAHEYWPKVMRLWAYGGAVRPIVERWVRARAEEEGPVSDPYTPAGGVPAEAMNALVPPAPGTEFAAPLIEWG